MNIWLATLSILASLTVAATAVAQPASKKVKAIKSKKNALKSSSPPSTKVASGVVADTNEQVRPLEELRLVEGDEKGNELKSLKAEFLVSKAEQAAINQANKLLRKYKGTEMEPELQFRLAELYMRKAKTERFFELHRESDTVVHLAPRLVKSASSRESVQKAISIYGLIQKNWQNFGQMDLVIFNHAFANQSLGQDKDAETLYYRLIQHHASSPLVPDAHLAIGEIAFKQAHFEVALDHFNAIKRFPESRVYPYGLYKAAWTHYNMRNPELGLKKLEEVVTYGKFVAQNKMNSRLDLRKEALSDMTVFYEDVYPAKDAYKYFVEQAGEAEVGPILLRMGTLYERHSRFNDQRIVLTQFTNKLPKSPLIPKVQNDLIAAYDALKQKHKAVETLEELDKICEPSSRWVKAQNQAKGENSNGAAADCQANLQATSLRMANKWLRAWKKLPTDISFADASEKAYEIYLRNPASREEHAQSRFTFAELLFARGKLRKASQEYAIVSDLDGVGTLNHDAAYAAVVSLEKAVGDKWSSEDERRFRELASRYVEKNPKGQYRLDLEYKMALLAYEKDRFDEAAPVFLRLGREYSDQEKGLKAQDLYLDILNIKKDYRAIRNYTTELLAKKGHSARDQKMRKLYETAYFLEVQGLEEKGDWQAALKEYQNFSKENSSSELAEKAMWNSMQLHFKLADFLNGAKAAEDYAVRYPNSKQSRSALVRAAQTFESMGQLSEAARVLGQLAGKDSKDSKRWMELAADFHALDGETAQARQIYKELRSGGSPDQRVRLLGKSEALEKNYGTAQTHAEILKTMIDGGVEPQASNAKVEGVEQLFQKGRHEEAFNEARRQLGSSRFNANQKARLRLVQAKVLESEFIKQSVKSRAERVGAVLAIKTEKLQKAQEALQSSIKYGDPRVSIEAFERLYNCYQHYVSALRQMPVPTGLSAEEAKVFRGEIDNLVVPLEEKSVDTLAQALIFARQQQFLDGSAARLESELNRINHQVDSNLAPQIFEPGLVLPVLAGGRQ